MALDSKSGSRKINQNVDLAPGARNLTTTGNITAGAFYGDGSNLTGISTAGANDALITITAGGGLTGGGGFTVDQAVDAIITVSHDDTSAQASVANTAFNVIQSITLDTYGHITAIESQDIGTAGFYVKTTGEVGTGVKIGLGSLTYQTLQFFAGTGLSVVRTDNEIQFSAPNAANWNTAYSYSQVGHLPLAGGTLTGNVTIQNGDLFISRTAVNGTATRKIRFAEGITTTSGFQGGYIYYNADSNIFQIGVHNAADSNEANDIPAISIDRSTANITATNITAASFVKSNGTSSQFLKADGSVDSNTYLTTIPQPINGDWWNGGFVSVGGDGVMEMGKYMDFHTSDSGGSADYDLRVTVSPGVFSVGGQVNATGGNSSQWNTAYSWGNHASVGYLTSLPVHTHDYLYSAPTQLVSTNLNDMSTSGVYFSNTSYSTNANIPFANYFTMLNIMNGDRQAQLWFGDTPGTMYWRPKQGATGWHGWENVITSNNIGSQSVNYASNAGTLDSIDSSQFLRSDAADSWSGLLSYTGSNNGLQVGGIRGTFGGVELIHLYNRVNIGYPSGWGGQSAPTYGLSVYGGVELATNSGYTSSGDSMRAPIFYDSNDTNYYANLASATSLYINGGVSQNNLVGRPYAVWGSTGTTGAVVIKFPGGTSNYGMIHAVIDIYEYSGDYGCTVIVSGHNWNGAWYNYGAQLIGRTNKPVRIGVKDGKYCIVIGNGSSSWSYGQVVLRKIQNGTYYQNVMNVGEGYTVNIESDSYTWISGDLRQLNITGNIISSVDMRAPIFYDTDNTGYYLDPANGGVALRISGAIQGDHVGWTGEHNKIQWHSSHMYFQNMNNGYWIFRRSNGSEPFLLHADGWGLASDSWRAPIFYDSNNTSYYLDPASTSNLNAVNVSNLNGFNPNNFGYFRISNGYFNNGGTTDNFIGDLGDNGHLSNGFTVSKVPWSYAGNSDVDTGIQTIEMAGCAVSTWHDGSYYTSLVIRPTTGTGGGSVYIYNNQGSGYSPGWRQVWTSSTDAYNYASTRSPIHYDVNNTNYYCDPNSLSRFDRLDPNEIYNYGWFRSHTSGNGVYNQATGQHFYSDEGAYWNMGGGNINGQGIRFRDTHNSTIRGYVYYDQSNNIGFLNQSGSWRLRVVGGDYALADGSSMRAQMFYDSNNTGYYVDPASTSVLNLINGRSFGNEDGGICKIDYPSGAQYNNSGSTVTGAIKITLPQSWTNTMMNLQVELFNYSSKGSVTLSISGYNYSAGPGWANTAAYILGATDQDVNYTVRYGHDGTKCCIWIGETNTVWNYPKIVVRSFQGGHSNYEYSKWEDGWAISAVTAFNTVYIVKGNLQIGRYPNVMYDYDNTGYYVDPSSTSNLNAVNIAGSITIGGGATIQESTDRADLIQITSNTSTWGGLQIRNSSNEGRWSFMTDGEVAGIYNDEDGFWHIYFTEAGATEIKHGDGNTKLATSTGGVSVTGAMTASGDVVAYSDVSIKENIKTIDNALEKVVSMRGVSYNRTDIDDKSTKIGVIAQEIQKVLPEVVQEQEDGLLGVSYGNITAVLIEAIKEQQKQIEELKAIVDGLTK